MKNSRIVKIFTFIFSLTLIISMMSLTIYAASDFDSYYTDSSSGWALKDLKHHRGSKTNSYSFSSTSVKETYAADLSGAISLWGTKISMSETATTGYGVITIQDNESSNAVATTSGLSYNTTTGHTTNAFTITINKPNYDNKTSSLKQKALAHEIGHVYGLDHFSDTSKIMNSSLVSTMTISTSDSAGMNLCTHAHTHGTTTTYTYENYSNLRHKQRCSTCGIYTLENHVWNAASTACTVCGYTK